MIEPVFFKLFFFQKMHQLMSKIKKKFQLKTSSISLPNTQTTRSFLEDETGGLPSGNHLQMRRVNMPFRIESSPARNM